MPTLSRKALKGEYRKRDSLRKKHKIDTMKVTDSVANEISKDVFNKLIVWTRVQLTINSRVVSTKTSKLSESVGVN